MTNYSQRICFILRPLKKAELSFFKGSDHLVFAKDEYQTAELKQSKCSKLFEELRQVDLDQKHIQRIIYFAHKKIGSRSTIEALQRKESSDWFYLKFSLYHRSKKLFFWIDALKEYIALNKLESKEIHLFSSDSLAVDLIHPEAKLHCPPKSKRSNPFPLRYLINYLFIFTLKALHWRTWLMPNNIKKSKHLILTNPYMDQEVFSLSKERFIQGDPHLEPLLEKCKNRDEFSFISQLRPPSLEQNHKLSLKSYLRKRSYSKKLIQFEPFLLRALFNKRPIRTFRKQKNALNDLFHSCKPASEERVLLDYCIKLSKILFIAAWREEAAILLRKKLNLDSLVCIDEHSLQNRSLTLPFRHDGTKLFAIQHGGISQANIAYRFHPNDKKYKPFPHLTLVRGSEILSRLSNQYYPKEKLKVVGHVRTDLIAAINNLHKLNQDQKQVLYATQPLPPADGKLKKQQLNDFLQVVKKMPEVQFVIKPHPNESDITTYKQIADQSDFHNLEVQEGNLYQLIAKSSLVITYYSTVGIEAIYFNKPLVTLDYQEFDLQSFLKAGVSFNAHNEKELHQICQAILNQELKLNQDKIAEFKHQRVGEIDGKVSERILHSILQEN
ncbi:MAG: CDP-glycerol glycerophosphotransferase family protein [Vicingaceae bacterium]